MWRELVNNRMKSRECWDAGLGWGREGRGEAANYPEGIGYLKIRERGNSLNETVVHTEILLRDRLDCEHKSKPVIVAVLVESPQPSLGSHWRMALP